MEVTQGKLSMGFSCGSDDMPALLLGNTLFGGSSNSKLFLNVREKLSLCYYASSMYHRQKGIITVSSGIEFQNYQRAYDEILSQLAAVQNGELEEWELASARHTAQQLRHCGRFPGQAGKLLFGAGGYRPQRDPGRFGAGCDGGFGGAYLPGHEHGEAGYRLFPEG